MPGRMARDVDKRTEPTVRGRTRTVEEWACWRGMIVETLVWRLEHGWEARDAVLVPVHPAAASVVVTAFGRTLTPGEWERENGVPATLIGKRIKLCQLCLGDIGLERNGLADKFGAAQL